MFSLEKAGEFMKSFLFGENPDPAEQIFNDSDAYESVRKEFEASVINDIKGKFEQRKTARQELELQWRLNINFYNGEQFTRADAYKNDIEETLPLNEWEERNAFNEIAPSVETRCAILSKRKNNLKNRPASANSEDRTAAKIGNKVLASTRSRLGMSELQQEANYMSGVISSAVWKTVWDSSSGAVVGIIEREMGEDEITNLPMRDYEDTLLGRKARTVYQMVHEGNVVTTIHSPFEIYPENIYAPCRANKRVMHVMLMSPEDVFNKWGKVCKGTEHQTYKVASTKNRVYGSAISGRTQGYMFSTVQMKNTVQVYEEWELPTPQYPQGRLIICTDEILLHYGPLPDAMGENGEYILPFDVQMSLKSDGFFGTSVVERMIPLQVKYNSVKNRIQDYINRVTIGVLVAQENSLVDEDYFLENGIAPGEIVLYKHGADQPRFMTMDDLPDDLAREEQELLNSFDRYSGVSQLAKQSIVPSQVTSGVAIAGLAEQDDTRVGLEAENIKHCLISIGKKWLKLTHDNVKYPRMVKELGKNNEFEIQQFEGNDLTSFDVFVESEPEASDTLSQRRQKVVELLNGGLFNDPKTGNITPEGRIKVFEMLELGDWENFVDADDDQKKRASRENNAMVIGEMAKLRDFDDDMIHISQHNNFRLKAEYEEAVEKNPQIEELFEQHVNEHLQALQQKSQTQMLQNQQQAQPQMTGQLSPATFGGETETTNQG